MKNLIEILKSETESLRVQYLKLTEEWAAKYYSRCEEQSKWSEVKWCEFYGLTPEVHNAGSINEWVGFPRGFYNTRTARIFDNLKNKIGKVIKLAPASFIDNEKESAENHYQDSILKLAARIEVKGLDIDKLTVSTAHVGVNIDTTITDGVKTVKASTIVASGQIQRPHYRYLVR